MKLHFRVYHRNVRNFESKECLFNICVLLHRIHNLQFFICVGFLTISIFTFTSWIFLYVWKMRKQFCLSYIYIYIYALLYKSHQIEDQFCEIIFLEQYKKGDNIKRQIFSLLHPISLLIFLHLSSFPPSLHFPATVLFLLDTSYNLSFHFRHPCLSSSSPVLTSCYCD